MALLATAALAAVVLAACGGDDDEGDDSLAAAADALDLAGETSDNAGRLVDQLDGLATGRRAPHQALDESALAEVGSAANRLIGRIEGSGIDAEVGDQLSEVNETLADASSRLSRARSQLARVRSDTKRLTGGGEVDEDELKRQRKQVVKLRREVEDVTSQVQSSIEGMISAVGAVAPSAQGDAGADLRRDVSSARRDLRSLRARTRPIAKRAGAAIGKLLAPLDAAPPSETPQEPAEPEAATLPLQPRAPAACTRQRGDRARQLH